MRRKPYRESNIFAKMALHLEVQYQYQEKTPFKTTSPTLNVDQLAQMPQSWLVQLHQATNNLDQQMVELLLDELDGNAQSLQEALRYLMYEFRYDEIPAVTHHSNITSTSRHRRIKSLQVELTTDQTKTFGDAKALQIQIH